ncbi:hypothetical protein IAT38_003039 [Cryptococcus sp. DSM 104549]
MIPAGQQQPVPTEWADWAAPGAPSNIHGHHTTPSQPHTATSEAGPLTQPQVRHDPAPAQSPVLAQGAYNTAGIPGYTSHHPRLVAQRANAPPPSVHVSCDFWGPDKNPGSRQAAVGHNVRSKQARPQPERQAAPHAAENSEVQPPAPWGQGVAEGDGSSLAGLDPELTGASGEVTAGINPPSYGSVPPVAPAPAVLPRITPEEQPPLPSSVMPGLDLRTSSQQGQKADSQLVHHTSTFNYTQQPHPQPYPQPHQHVLPTQVAFALQGKAVASVGPHPVIHGSFNKRHLSPHQQSSPSQSTPFNQQISPNQQTSPGLQGSPTQPLPSGLTPHNPLSSTKPHARSDNTDIDFVSHLLQGAISPSANDSSSLSPVEEMVVNGSFAQMGSIPMGDAASFNAGPGQLLPLISSSSTQDMTSVSPVWVSPHEQVGGQIMPGPPGMWDVTGAAGATMVPEMLPWSAGGHYREDDEAGGEERWSTLVAPVELLIPPGDIQAAKDGWWSWILLKFSDDRQVANRMVVDACATFFSDRYIWIDFLQPNLFFQSLFFRGEPGSSVFRLRAAPHILLAILAHVTLLREGQTLEGQHRAFMFADEALSLISYCMHAGSRDPSLFATCLILTTFESQPHVYHSLDRVTSIVRLLDGVGMSVYAHHLDVDVRTVSTSLVGYPRIRSIAPAYSMHGASVGTVFGTQLEAQSEGPLWNPNWTQAEMCKEEMRRMCWCASGLLANYTLWRSAQGLKWDDFEMSHPERFRLLFPGEAFHIEIGDYEGGKTTPWAMYHRVLSLWHFVMYHRPLTPLQHAQVVDELRAVEEDQSYILQGGNLNIYTWLGLSWIMPIRQLLGALNQRGLSYWFRNQILFFKKLNIGLPGFPQVVRPLHCMWYILQAYSSIELSVKYPEMWNDADHIYVNALVVVDQIAEHWHCEAALSALLNRLKSRHAKVLKERLEVIKGKNEAVQQMQGMALALTPEAMEWRVLQLEQWGA